MDTADDWFFGDDEVILFALQNLIDQNFAQFWLSGVTCFRMLGATVFTGILFHCSRHFADKFRHCYLMVLGVTSVCLYFFLFKHTIIGVKRVSTQLSTEVQARLDN